MDVPYIWNTYQMILFHEKAWGIYIYKNYKKWASITKKDRRGLSISQAAGRRGRWKIWLSDTSDTQWWEAQNQRGQVDAIIRWVTGLECRHGPWLQRVIEMIKRIWCSYTQNKWGFPGGNSGKKKSTCQHRRCEFDPWVKKIPWRRKWQPTAVFLQEKSHGQRSLAGYSP